METKLIDSKTNKDFTYLLRIKVDALMLPRIDYTRSIPHHLKTQRPISPLGNRWILKESMES